MMSQVKVLSKVRTITVSPGQNLFNVDENADFAYRVVEGVLLISHFSLNGREVITSLYFPGEICGGFSALTGLTYDGTARAPKKSSVVVEPIRRSCLAEMVADDHSLYHELIATQREKERFKDRMLLGVMADTCEQRMASTLIWLEQKRTQSSPQDHRFYLSRQELADLIGATMETVIRVLSRFRKKGLIVESDGFCSMDTLALSALVA